MTQLNKKVLKKKLGDVEQQNLRMGAALADLRMRNGDLADIVQEVAPDRYIEVTPMTTYNRYSRILKLVETCIDLASIDGYDPLEEERYLERIISQATSIRDFYAEHLETKRVMSPEHIAAMQAGRKKNNG